MFSHGKQLIGYFILALLISGCGGGNGSGAGQNVNLSLSEYDYLVRQGETIRVTLTTNIPATLGINFSEVESGININVEQCVPASATCEVWAITPSARVIAGRYNIQILSSGSGNNIIGSVKLTVFPPLATAPASIVAGEGGAGDTLVVLTDGTLVGWGLDSTNDLADGFQLGHFTPSLPRQIQIAPSGDLPPGPYSYTTNSNGKDRYTVLLDSNGDVWQWGLFFADGGTNKGSLVSTLPFQVNGLDQITAIATGAAHNLALRASGTVWAWGREDKGQLATSPSKRRQFDPVRVPSLPFTTSIATGGKHSLALTSDGSVWAWGDNEYGQLGTDPALLSETYNVVPTQIPNLTGVQALAGGPSHSLVLHNGGTVWAWGQNNSGQLGNGQTGGFVHTPAQIPGLNNIQAIAVGGDFAFRGYNLALRNDGTVWSWGNNFNGQLGIGGGLSSPDVLSPVQIPGLSNVTAIFAGRYDVSYAITSECGGRVYAWGLQSSLGNGLISTSVPVPVPGIGDLGDCGNLRRLMVYVSVKRDGQLDIASQSRVTVSSDQGILQCIGEGSGDDRICWQDVPINSSITLTATPSSGARANWHWDCSDNATADPNTGAISSTLTMDMHKYCKVRVVRDTPIPTAVITATPNSVPAGANIVFDGSTSTGNISTYAWDFEDDGTIDASGQTVNHSYPAAGSYVARLRVTDDQGRIAETTTAITVVPNNQSNTLTVQTSGNAVVRDAASSGLQINCGALSTANDCTEEIPNGNSVVLNVFIPLGSNVTSVLWVGCDQEAGLEGCSINNMTAPRTVTASFMTGSPP